MYLGFQPRLRFLNPVKLALLASKSLSTFNSALVAFPADRFLSRALSVAALGFTPFFKSRCARLAFAVTPALRLAALAFLRFQLRQLFEQVFAFQ